MLTPSHLNLYQRNELAARACFLRQRLAQAPAEVGSRYTAQLLAALAAHGLSTPLAHDVLSGLAYAHFRNPVLPIFLGRLMEVAKPQPVLSTGPVAAS
jgi:hypothetical protein